MIVFGNVECLQIAQKLFLIDAQVAALLGATATFYPGIADQPDTTMSASECPEITPHSAHLATPDKEQGFASERMVLGMLRLLSLASCASLWSSQHSRQEAPPSRSGS